MPIQFIVLKFNYCFVGGKEGWLLFKINGLGWSLNEQILFQFPNILFQLIHLININFYLFVFRNADFLLLLSFSRN
jgi:hypothetical protein